MRNAYHYLGENSIEKLPYRVSVGLHPWHIETENVELQLRKVQNLASLKNVAAIGEAGLDRAIDTPINIQLQAFEAQVKIAEKVHKPMIIHCVRAYSDIFTLLKKYDSISMCLHGYTGNSQQTEAFLKLKNVYFSFGKQLWTEKTAEIFNIIPIEKIFLETDNASKSIEEIYLQAASLKKIKEDQLLELIYLNKQKFFT